MLFDVVVTQRSEFEDWLQRQAQPAVASSEPISVRGREVFVTSGCGSCHAVRGTVAKGTVGPDLTHVGSRLSLGAGVLPNTPDDFLRWITHNETLKPEVHMPKFNTLPENDRRALAAYLDSLE